MPPAPALASPALTTPPSRLSAPALLAWVAFCVLSLIHVTALATGAKGLADPTKLTLMPALLAAAWLTAGRNLLSWGGALLAGALVFSFLGDGAGTLTPFLPTLPAMLGFFAVAHLAYIALFWRVLAVRGLTWWLLWIPAWWVAMVLVIAPQAGALAPAVAAYGVVLGCTAAAAYRGPRPAAWGGVLFLASDSLLAFLLFAPATPPWVSPAVMATYCAGQGLLAWSASRALRSA